MFIDDATRLGFVALVDDERPASAVDALERAAAFYASQGIRIERVLTDIQATCAFAPALVGRPWKDAKVRLPSAVAQ